MLQLQPLPKPLGVPIQVSPFHAPTHGTTCRRLRFPPPQYLFRLLSPSIWLYDRAVAVQHPLHPVLLVNALHVGVPDPRECLTHVADRS